MNAHAPPSNFPPDWPAPPPADKVVVLHTRVVSGTGGGPDKTILLEAPFLADSRYWLASAYMHPPGDPGFEVIRQRARDWNSPLIGIPDRGVRDVSVLRAMLRICKAYNVQIWHGHDYKSNLFGLLLRPFHRMKLFTTVHGWVKHTSKTPLYYAIDRYCLRWYHHVACVSDDLYDMVKPTIRADRLTLVRNGIDHEAFVRKHPPGESPQRRERGVGADRLLIGAVGRLSAEKGFDLLIQSVASLIKQGHKLSLWIAGEGAAQAELQALIDKLGVGEHVSLIGFCKDTVAFYHALDLFVLSSLREGLPNVCLEAMAMSVPMVATKVAGVPMLAQDGVSALMCEVGDLPSLTAAIARAAGDADLRNRLAQAARQVIVERFSFRARMDHMRKLYDQTLGA